MNRDEANRIVIAISCYMAGFYDHYHVGREIAIVTVDDLYDLKTDVALGMWVYDLWGFSFEIGPPKKDIEM